ncbi:MAG: hypothetical protein JSS53_00575 [Proteobacteria bacterium]|nr:hypothetical protein [Pseudomonadota bacterium]
MKNSKNFSEKYCNDPMHFIKKIKFSDSSLAVAQDFYDVVVELNLFPITAPPKVLWFQPDSEDKYPSSASRHLATWSAHYLPLMDYPKNSNIIVSAGPIKPPISNHVFSKVEGTPFFSISDSEHVEMFLNMLFNEKVDFVVSLGMYGSVHGKDFPDYRTFETSSIHTQQRGVVDLKDEYQNGSLSTVEMSTENGTKTFRVMNFEIKDNTPLYFSFEQMCYLIAGIQNAQINDSSVLAHCASGVGRTGVFSYFTSLIFDERFYNFIESLLESPSEISLDDGILQAAVILQTDLNNIRAQRHSLQTPEQLSSALINAILFCFINKKLKLFYQIEDRFADFSLVFDENQLFDIEIIKMYGKLRKHLIAAVSNLDFYYAFTIKAKGIIDLLQDVRFSYYFSPENTDSQLHEAMNMLVLALQKIASFVNKNDFISGKDIFIEFESALNKVIDKYCMSNLFKERLALSKLKQFFQAILTGDLGVAIENAAGNAAGNEKSAGNENSAENLAENENVTGNLRKRVIAVIKVIDNQLKYLQYQDRLKKLVETLTFFSGPLSLKRKALSQSRGFQKFRLAMTQPAEIRKKSFDANVFLLTYIYLTLESLKDLRFKEVWSIMVELLSKDFDVKLGLTGKEKEITVISKALVPLVPEKAIVIKGLINQLIEEMEKGFSIKILKRNVPDTNAVNTMFFRDLDQKIDKYREYVLDFIYFMTKVIVDGSTADDLCSAVNNAFDHLQKESNFYKSMSSDPFFSDFRNFCLEEAQKLIPKNVHK